MDSPFASASEKIPITVIVNDEGRAADQCITLLNAFDRIYVHRNKLVTIGREYIDILNLRRERYYIRVLFKQRLRLLLSKFFSFSDAKGSDRAGNLLNAVVEAILAEEISPEIPRIRHISTVPIVLDDGNFFRQGFHEDSGLYVAGSDWVSDAVLPEPTYEIAQKSIAIIRRYFANVTFASELDFSVFLAALMTAFVCRQIGPKPAFVISAEEPGSGKSSLVRAITTLALGDGVASIVHPKNEAIFNQELAKELRKHPGIISVDNVTFPVQSARLCSILSEPKIRIPAAGGFSATEVDPALIFLNGNKFKIVGSDLARRVLAINLLERPQREIGQKTETDWIGELLWFREFIIPEMLGLLRAFAFANRPAQRPALASFDEWSRAVRDPIIWAGFPDPVVSQEQFGPRQSPVGRESGLGLLFRVTKGRPFTALSLAQLVASGELSDRELRAALSAGSARLSTTKIGQMLSALSACNGEPFTLRRVGAHAGSSRWLISGAASVASP